MYYVIYFREISSSESVCYIFDYAEDAVPKEGRAPTESEMQQIFLPYRGFCARKGVSIRHMPVYSRLLCVSK